MSDRTYSRDNVRFLIRRALQAYAGKGWMDADETAAHMLNEADTKLWPPLAATACPDDARREPTEGGDV